MAKYFGTDGIRGEVNKTLFASLAFKVGKALIKLNNDTVIIASDTRESNNMLAYAVASGAMSMGINVIMAGVIPTPALIYYSYLKEITGVMITASHNPFYDNGLKVLSKGYKLTDDEEKMLEEAIDDDISCDSCKVGKLLSVDDYKNEYLNFMKQYTHETKLQIALDCANGATYETAPLLFENVAERLEVMASNPDGVNINTNVGSTHISELQKFVLYNKCDVGFAFDGDGDRVIAVDSTGEVIDGDKLIFIIANYLKAQNQLNKNTVVFTKMSNLGMLKYLHEHEIQTSITDVGDKYVVRELLENKYSVGGESSGHIVMPNILHTGDGTLNALFLCKIMNETGKSLKELSDCFIMYPDKTINVKVTDKTKVMSNKELFDRVDEIKKALGEDSKVIVRASGTEQLIRVSVSCMDDLILDKYINELVDIVKSI